MLQIVEKAGITNILVCARGTWQPAGVPYAGLRSVRATMTGSNTAQTMHH